MRPLQMIKLFLLLAVIIGVLFLVPDISQAEINSVDITQKIVRIIPDQMILGGDVATKANTLNKCTEHLVADMPEGGIILGVNPNSCNPTDGKGGSATAEISLPDIYSPTVYTLKLSWPNQNGKGLYSPHRNQTGSIMFDGQSLWNKRTAVPGTDNEYNAAENETVLTSVVITGTRSYTLTINVPEQTVWNLGRIELAAYPYPKTMKGIGYSPYRNCQYPGGKLEPSEKDIKEDLFRLSHTSTSIRTYSSTGINSTIPAIAKSMGLKVFAGAWLDGNQENDEKEIQGLITLANKIDVDGLIVGNEYYLRHRQAQDISYLLKQITKVREGIKNKSIPITTAEVSGLMFNWENTVPKIDPLYQKIIDEIDFVLVHIYPFWDSKTIKGAAALTVNQYKAIQKIMNDRYGNKRVMIGETGWPSAGERNGLATPSLENQRRYSYEFLLLAEQEKVDFMYFDAFDELWKTEEPGLVGQNWGYSYTDRTVKHNFNGVLIPPDQLKALPVDRYSPEITSDKYTNTQTFPVYTDWPTHFQFTNISSSGRSDNKQMKFIPSGFMGDVESISLFECDRTSPRVGDMASKNTFSFNGSKEWGGIYWLSNNNWNGPGINIYEKLNVNKGAPIILTFWARGERGSEKVIFKVGGVTQGKDSIKLPAQTKWITLEKAWNKYTIDLSGEDLSNVVGGFCWVTNKDQNPDRSSITFSLDNVRYEIE